MNQLHGHQLIAGLGLVAAAIPLALGGAVWMALMAAGIVLVLDVVFM